MNTQHKIGCKDLGCPGCDAGDPPSVTEPEKCPSCHSNERKRNLCDARLAGHRNIRFEAHLPTYKRCVTCRDPWHNAAQPEPREEVMPNDPQSTRTNTTSAVTGAASVANTPQPDLEEEILVIEIARELYDRFVMGGWEPEDAHDQIREWLAARRLSPDRKLVEAALRLAHEWAAKFPLGTEDSGADAHAANAVYKACAAALKTQEPAPEVIETCRCLLQRFIPHTGKLYRFVPSCDLCETQEPASQQTRKE